MSDQDDNALRIPGRPWRPKARRGRAAAMDFDVEPVDQGSSNPAALVGTPDATSDPAALASIVPDLGAPAKKGPRIWPEPTGMEPSQDELMYQQSGIDEPMATDGCLMVDIDGECTHGHRSWVAHFGLIEGDDPSER